MIQLLSPELDIPHAAADPTGPAADDLLRRVTSAPPPATRRRWGLRLAVGGALVAGAAAAVVAAGGWLPESSPAGPAPAQAAALKFTTGGKYLEIRILTRPPTRSATARNWRRTASTSTCRWPPPSPTRSAAWSSKRSPCPGSR